MKNLDKMVSAIFLIFFFWSSVSLVGSGEIYKWEDKDGNIVFSDSPPPPGVKGQATKFKASPNEKPALKKEVPRVNSQPLEGKRAYEDITVIIYTTEWCPYSRKAKEYLKSFGVNVIEYDVERDKTKNEERRQKAGQGSGVPVIDVEGIILRGFNPYNIRAAIEKRRSL